VTELGECSTSPPLPNAPGGPPVQPLPHVHRDDAHADGPTTDAVTYALAEQDGGEGEGEGDDEDRTKLDQPVLEPDDEVEEHEAEDMDMNMDADTREVRDVMDNEDEMEFSRPCSDYLPPAHNVLGLGWHL
jgi:hypothetical protein